MRSRAEPEHLHVFDAGTGRRIDGTDAVSALANEAGLDLAVEERDPRRRWSVRRRLAARPGSLRVMLAPAFVDLRRLRLLSVPAELRPRAVPHATVPRPAEARTSASTRSGTCSARRSSATACGPRCCSLLLTVPTGIFLGIVLADLAHQKLKGVGIYRTIFSSTVATSVAVASVIFGTLMNPQVGLLPWLGIDPRVPPILQDPKYALIGGRGRHDLAEPRSLVHPDVAPVSRRSPTSSSRRPTSTARAHGRRSGTSRCRCCRPRSSSRSVVGSIFAFQTFGQIDLLTQGGPLRKTNVLDLLHLHRVCGNSNDGEGGGARHRAVRHHHGARPCCSCASSSGGCTMPGDASRSATR